MWDFTTWPLADLIEELEIVQTLTPDQWEVITEIDRRLGS
jgi:sporulation-control protein spo0M